MKIKFYLFLIIYCINTFSIETIKLHLEDDYLSYPCININSHEKIKLSFDDLSDEYKDFRYKIVLCDRQFNISDIISTEYIDGFNTGEIQTYWFSQKTTQNYIHYEYTFPNENVKIKKSGNYKIQIILNDSIIGEERFFIYENTTKIEAFVKESIEKLNYQEVEMNIYLENGEKNISIDYLHFKIVQNNRYDRILDVTPSEIFDNKYVFKQCNNIFAGENEFYYFNSKDIRFPDRNIETVLYEKPYFNFYLKPFVYHFASTYKFENDINGKFKIDVANYNNSETEADYVNITFSLDEGKYNPLVEYYVVGKFSNWEYNDKYKLCFNSNKNLYMKTLLLKQGFYNFQYIAIDKVTKKQIFELTQENHFQTENDYLIFVYLYDFIMKYDKLIGYKIINSNDPKNFKQ